MSAITRRTTKAWGFLYAFTFTYMCIYIYFLKTRRVTIENPLAVWWVGGVGVASADCSAEEWKSAMAEDNLFQGLPPPSSNSEQKQSRQSTAATNKDPSPIPPSALKSALKRSNPPESTSEKGILLFLFCIFFSNQSSLFVFCSLSFLISCEIKNRNWFLSFSSTQPRCRVVRCYFLFSFPFTLSSQIHSKP